MAEDIFNNEPQVTPSLEDLVGEGRKYSSPDELAKGYAHIEGFAEKLKVELAELRAEKDAREAREKNQSPPSPEPDPVPNADPQNEPPKKSSTPSDEDFRSQIREQVRALNDEETSLRNLDTAAKRLVEVLGSQAKATEAIQAKADELGVSVEWMKESAMRSPSAFYNMMGVPQSGSSRSTPAPSSDVRFQDTHNLRNFEHYDKIRKDNPKLYWSREMQLEMQTQAKGNPDFYKR